MMVAKATAQRQGICSALVVALDLSFIMLSPLPDSDRARLATCPFGPRPEHPDCALGLEEAPARARGLPASPNLINLRNDNNTSLCKHLQNEGQPQKAISTAREPSRRRRAR